MKAETENIISLILLLSHDLELSVDKENTLKFWSARDWGGDVRMRESDWG